MDVMLPSLDGYLIGELYQWTQLLVVTHIAVRVVRIFERRKSSRQPGVLPRRRRAGDSYGSWIACKRSFANRVTQNTSPEPS